MVSTVVVLIGVIICVLAISKLTVVCVSTEQTTEWRRAARQERQESVVAITERLIEGANTHAVNRKAWRGWRTMTVFRVVRETADCVSFYLKDAEDQPLPPFLPGQYITVGVKNVEGRLISRCYSLSDAPDSRYYRITVKRVPRGSVSNLLHDSVKVGTELQARAPSGNFTPIAKKEVPLVLIAAGIGITPMISIVKHAEKCNPGRAIELFFQARDLSQAPLLKDAAKWASANSHVRFYLYLSQPGARVPKWVCATGRLSAEEVLRVCNDRNAQFLFCGPGPMLASFQRGLIDNGVPESMVAVEAFESIQKIKATEDAIAEQDQSDLDSSSSTVHFAKSKMVGECNSKNPTILDAAESLGVELDSGCRSGQCGACLIKVLSGNICYDQKPDYRPLDPGQALACVARPNGSVEIDA